MKGINSSILYTILFVGILAILLAQKQEAFYPYTNTLYMYNQNRPSSSSSSSTTLIIIISSILGVSILVALIGFLVSAYN